MTKANSDCKAKLNPKKPMLGKWKNQFEVIYTVYQNLSTC